MAVTTSIAIFTAFSNIMFLIGVAAWNLNEGIALAAVGVVTFFGVLVASSVFEEHRHDHRNPLMPNSVFVGKNIDPATRTSIETIVNTASASASNFTKFLALAKFNKLNDNTRNEIVTEFNNELKKPRFSVVDTNQLKQEQSSTNFIQNIIVGKGILRKALASSLILTYVLLIGFSFDAQTLDDQFVQSPDTDDADAITPDANDSSTDSESTPSETLGTSSNSIYFVDMHDSTSSDTTDETDDTTDKTTETGDNSSKILDKDPQSLLQHFTIVVSLVIGFYFGTNIVTTLVQNSKASKDTLSDAIRNLETKLDTLNPASDQSKLSQYKSLQGQLETAMGMPDGNPKQAEITRISKEMKKVSV